MKNTFLVLLFSLIQIKATAQEWTVYTVDNSILTSNTIISISVDQDNSKWIALRDLNVSQTTLIKIDSNNQWSIFDETNSIIPPNVNISSHILVDSNNKKWIGLENGTILQISDNSDWQLFEDNPNLFLAPITDIAEHPDGRIFFLAGNLVSYDPITELWEGYNIYDEIGRLPIFLEIDENGTFWMADVLLTNGLLKWDSNGEWTIFNESLNSWEEITNLTLIDDELFVAHNDRLISAYITKWGINDNSNMIIDSSANKSYGIINDSDGNFWITYSWIAWHANPTICVGDCGDGVKIFDENYTFLQHFHPDNSNLLDNMAHPIVEDADGTIWLGTLTGGLARYGDMNTSDVDPYNKLKVKVFPTPFYDELNFNIEGIQEEELNLQIYNGQGSLVIDEKKIRNNQSITFNQSDLPSGIYFYILRSGQDRFNGLLVKM